MIRPFVLTTLTLFLMILFVGVHYIFGDQASQTERINAVASLTQIGSPSLGVAYYEPRMPGSKSAGNIVYPEMMPIDRMDFVYAK